MSGFRITYRKDDPEGRTYEDVEAVEFIQQEPWIVFLDPSGVCLTIRSEEVNRVERRFPAPRVTDAQPAPASYPTLPST